MPSFHSFIVRKGIDKYDLPAGTFLLINRDLKSGKLDQIPINNSELLKLISDASQYLSTQCIVEQGEK
jgi:hypothetical protein